MSLSSAELWQRISAHQLASPMQCRSWAAEAAAGLSASEAIDVSRMASQLVALGKLSQYQADILLSGSDEPLVRHGWRIIEPVNFAQRAAADVRGVWNDWWLATKAPSSNPAWVRWLAAADLEQESIRAANPSLPLALRHSQVATAHLQGVSPPEMVAGTLQLSVSPLEGKLLSGLIAGQPLSIASVMQLLLQASAALAALHVAGLAHGRVAPDRLCLDEEQNWHLLRDPLCAATLGISQPSLGLMGNRLPGKLTAAHFMAPEFLLPAQAATPQTDCYALGCVAWLALTGQPPLTGKQPEQILAAHADQKVDLRQIAHVPEPLTRCILHCLAKNPDARFAGAAELRESLVEAQRLIESGTVLVSTQPQAVTQTKPNTAQPNTATTPKPAEPVKAEPVKAEPVKAEPVKTEPVKTVAASKPTVVSEPGTPAKPAATAPAATATSAAPQKQVEPLKSAAPLKPATPQVAAQAAATSQTLIPSTPPVKVVHGELLTTASAQPQARRKSEPLAAKLAKALAPAPSAPAPSAPASNAPLAAVEKQAVAVAPVRADAVIEADAPLAASPQEPASTIAPAQGIRSVGKGKPVVRSSVRRPSSKRKKNNWLVPAMGGGALVALLLLILVLNGGLGSPASSSVDKKPVVAAQGGTDGTDTALVDGEQTKPADPRLEHFELVDSSMPVLWAPPREPERLPLDLLPPGGQIFLSLRPAAMFTRAESKELLGLFDDDLGSLWSWLSSEAGVPVEAIDQVTIAAYAGQSGAPQFALRVHLQTAQSLQQLKTAWGNPTEAKAGEHAMLVSGDRGYYVAAQPLVDSQSVAEFLVGPTELVREAVELQGAAGPLNSQLEQLWQWTDQKSDLSVLLAPSFLFTEGRQLVERAPERLADQLLQWLSRDMRGAMLNTSLNDDWFYEVRLTGASDRDAGAIQQKMNDALQKLPQDVESWFVSQSPHPYWRAIALRFPNMLRALAEQTRFGVENGQAVANGYLPAEAAPNLLYASWIAMQPSATLSAGAVVGAATASPAEKPLTPEQILDRPITVATDQQGIEIVLQLIGEEANGKLPSGTKSLRFELDGPAFQRSGITRNQQIRDFKIESQPVRVALTELAKRGNPGPGVSDLRSDEQKLIWVLTEEADKPGEWMVSLTSREAATAAKKALPAEFAPAPQ